MGSDGSARAKYTCSALQSLLKTGVKANAWPDTRHATFGPPESGDTHACVE
jgi:hypothetical protein